MIDTKHAPWGSTLIWANVPGKYTGKIMRIESGQRMSLQFHQYKEETVIVLYGTMVFEKNNVTYELSPGMYAHIPPGTPHRMGAIDNGDFVIIAEVSTFDDGDIIRLEDDYGRT